MLKCRNLCFYRSLVPKIEPRTRSRLLSRQRETRLCIEYLFSASDPIKVQLTGDYVLNYVHAGHFRAIDRNLDHQD